MRCFQVLSLIVGFAFVSNALPQAPARRHVASKQAVSPTNSVLLKDFILSSFVATSTSHAVHHQYNRSMSCQFNLRGQRSYHWLIIVVFSDPNSNTSTVCASKWTDGADSNSTTAHLGPSYLVCDTTNGTAKPEAFDWYFASYIDYSHFSLELAHSFSDPAYVLRQVHI